MKSAHLNDIGSGEFRKSMLLPASNHFGMAFCATGFTLSGPSLCVPVCGVFSEGSQEKMIQIYTDSVVASVAHAQPFRDVSVPYSPREPVDALIPAKEIKSTVSLLGSRRPHPAASDVPVFCDIRHRSVSVHFRPKSFRDFLRKLRHNFRSFIHGVFVFGVRAARSVMNSAPLVPFNKKPAAVNTLCSSS